MTRTWFNYDFHIMKTKRLIFIAILFMAFLLPAIAVENTSGKDAIEGTWKTIDDETGEVKSLVYIWVHKGVAYGKITKLYRKPTENQNPVCDKCKGWRENKPITGMRIMQGLKKDGNVWKGGTIVDPKNGKTYGCQIEATANDQKLNVRGYLGVSALGRTQTWVRVR